MQRREPRQSHRHPAPDDKKILRSPTQVRSVLRVMGWRPINYCQGVRNHNDI